MPYKSKVKQKAAQHASYLANKTLCAQRQRAQRSRAQTFIADLKKAGCARCGYAKYVGALEYHHRDMRTKDSSLAQAIRDKWSDQRILLEVAKCVLLCSNCHREVHAGLWMLDELAPQGPVQA